MSAPHGLAQDHSPWETSSMCAEELHRAEQLYTDADEAMEVEDWVVAIEGYQQALGLYEQLGQHQEIADLHSNLGICCYQLSRWRDTEQHHQQALEGYTCLDQSQDVADALTNLGNVYAIIGRWSDAERAHQEAGRIYQGLGQMEEVADAGLNLGVLYQYSGRFLEAVAAYEAVVGVFAELEVVEKQAMGWSNLGVAYGELGRWEDAERAHRQALGLQTQAQSQSEVAATWTDLGVLYTRTGQWPQAREAYHKALDLYGDLNLRFQVADVHLDLGACHHTFGRWSPARMAYQQALQLYRQLAVEEGQAAALTNLGLLAVDMGHERQGLRQLNQARQVYLSLGMARESAFVAVRMSKILLAEAQQAPVGSSRGQQDLERAKHLAIPAHIMVDNVRFQFGHAVQRIRWASTARFALDAVCSIAVEANDRGLVAELVETQINSTAHYSHFSGQTSSSIHRETLTGPEPTSQNGIDTESETLAQALVAGGAARLLAGSRLPAGPAPTLNIPTRSTSTGRTIALGTWLEDYPYPPIERPPGSIDTW